MRRSANTPRTTTAIDRDVIRVNKDIYALNIYRL